MSEERFTYGETIDYNFFDVFEEKKYVGMIQRDSTKIVDRLNEQQVIITALKEENEQLRQKIKHWVYVDVDNGKGCMNCKFNFESNCLIMCCGTYDCLEGISKCDLKYWECKDG